MYVAWRAREAVVNAPDVLLDVFGQILGRSAKEQAKSVAAA
jgi:2,4-dichlorophenol 6-monooxygenase